MTDLALVLQTKMAENAEADTRLQLAPNTQQFVGDPYENRKIESRWGKPYLGWTQPWFQANH